MLLCLALAASVAVAPQEPKTPTMRDIREAAHREERARENYSDEWEYTLSEGGAPPEPVLTYRRFINREQWKLQVVQDGEVMFEKGHDGKHCWSIHYGAKQYHDHEKPDTYFAAKFDPKRFELPDDQMEMRMDGPYDQLLAANPDLQVMAVSEEKLEGEPVRKVHAETHGKQGKSLKAYLYFERGSWRMTHFEVWSTWTHDHEHIMRGSRKKHAVGKTTDPAIYRLDPTRVTGFTRVEG